MFGLWRRQSCRQPDSYCGYEQWQGSDGKRGGDFSEFNPVIKDFCDCRDCLIEEEVKNEDEAKDIVLSPPTEPPSTSFSPSHELPHSLSVIQSARALLSPSLSPSPSPSSTLSFGPSLPPSAKLSHL
mmetsp:Transcript_4578/g.6601  ORF Transcript_4578/g.6601 Transcript_4578/m.6601 type:complete len:127 (-) Transcript_4578:535-915(-)